MNKREFALNVLFPLFGGWLFGIADVIREIRTVSAPTSDWQEFTFKVLWGVVMFFVLQLCWQIYRKEVDIMEKFVRGLALLGAVVMPLVAMLYIVGSVDDRVLWPVFGGAAVMTVVAGLMTAVIGDDTEYY